MPEPGWAISGGASGPGQRQVRRPLRLASGQTGAIPGPAQSFGRTGEEFSDGRNRVNLNSPVKYRTICRSCPRA